MAETLFKEVNYSLSKLIEDIAVGEIALPDIQRPFVWKNTKIRDLFDSMYRGYPVGYMLFWSNAASDHTRQIGADQKQNIPRLLVIDGQQRLTSLFAVLRGAPVIRDDFSEEHIQIAFNPLEDTFQVADAAIRKDAHWIPNVSEIWKKETDIFDLAESYLDNLKKNHEVTTEQTKQVRSAIQKVSQLTAYPFTALELSSNISEEQVAEVFVRINSKGTPLNQADFILTLMSVFWDEGRHTLEDFCRKSRVPPKSGPSPFNHFIEPDPDHMLRVSVALGFRRARVKHVYSILRGKDLESGEFSDEMRDQQFEVLKDAQQRALDLQNWAEFQKAMVRAGYRGAGQITSKTAIIYSYALFLIGKYDYGVKPKDLRDAIARWFYMATLTGRYTDSPESQMEADLADLRDVSGAEEFVSNLDRRIANSLTDDFWAIQLPAWLETSSARSPTLFAFYAAQNLLNAPVLFSSMKVSELLDPTMSAKKAATERHHLFPKNYLKKEGITGTRNTNQIANFALVEWSDNIKISDHAPSDYEPKYAKRFSESDLKKMYRLHALPERWASMEYREFLEARRKLIAQIIHRGFEKLRG